MGSFRPLVFQPFGGMGSAATSVFKRIAFLLSVKREQPYSLVLSWLQCLVSFLCCDLP